MQFEDGLRSHPWKTDERVGVLLSANPRRWLLVTRGADLSVLCLPASRTAIRTSESIWERVELRNEAKKYFVFNGCFFWTKKRSVSSRFWWT
jgi:hypothetical protein